MAEILVFFIEKGSLYFKFYWLLFLDRFPASKLRHPHNACRAGIKSKVMLALPAHRIVPRGDLIAASQAVKSIPASKSRSRAYSSSGLDCEEMRQVIWRAELLAIRIKAAVILMAFAGSTALFCAPQARLCPFIPRRPAQRFPPA
ncbi:MAG: hypothetical protein RSE54_09485, partial [Ruthenibacterium sp.]